jgi:ubiquinone/menaquinone biosynthesis C-methylase UbiE
VNPPARVSRSVAQARVGYDRIAGIYDLLAGASERPYRRHALALMALRPGEHVLEIGCGTGEALAELAGITVYATGLDLSPRMLEQAGARLRALGRSAVLVEGDGHSLPFADASQDAVFMSFVLDLIDTPDLPRFLG